MHQRRGVRLFWPIILIGVGSILLLSNLGVITGNPWTIILQLWPVLLIAGGLRREADRAVLQDLEQRIQQRRFSDIRPSNNGSTKSFPHDPSV